MSTAQAREPASRLGGVVVPAAVAILIAAAAEVAMWSQRQSIPDPLATQFGGDGRATSYTSYSAFAVGLGLLLLVLPLALIALGAAVRATRMLGSIACGLSASIATLGVGITLTQRGLPDPAAATMQPLLWLLPLSSIAGILATALVWFFTRTRRSQEPVRSTTQPGTRLSTPAGVSVAWSGRTRHSRIGLGIVAGVAVLALAGGAASVVLAHNWLTLAPMVPAFVIVVVAIGLIDAHVSIGRHGVNATSFGFIRTLHVPLNEILRASVVEHVNCLADYGGYGYRIAADGTRALTTGSGSALRLERNNRPDVIITIDDTARAAATVNTLLSTTASTSAVGPRT